MKEKVNSVININNKFNVVFNDNKILSLSDDIVKEIITYYFNNDLNIVVGYRILVNGIVFTYDGWFNEFDIFETKEDLIRWCNIFGYGCGNITRNDRFSIQEVTLAEIKDNLNDKNLTDFYIQVPNYDDDIDDICPHCGEEVVLKSVFSNQKCPKCGKLISPCSLCDMNICDCNNCPLQKLLFNL